MEGPDVRRERGKDETGTIVLEAMHSGNNVFIRIRDDGGGIDVARVRAKIAERGLLTAAAAEELTGTAKGSTMRGPGARAGRRPRRASAVCSVSTTRHDLAGPVAAPVRSTSTAAARISRLASTRPTCRPSSAGAGVWP